MAFKKIEIKNGIFAMECLLQLCLTNSLIERSVNDLALLVKGRNKVQLRYIANYALQQINIWLKEKELGSN